MRLILHIGSDKTGTTSIQKALSLSRNYLAQKGVLYPQPENSDNHNLLAVGFVAKNGVNLVGSCAGMAIRTLCCQLPAMHGWR